MTEVARDHAPHHPDADGSAATSADTVEAVLRSRHRCRAFNERPIDANTLRRLFEMSQQTASWCNVQPWRVRLLSDPDRASLEERLVRHAPDAPQQPDLAPPEHYRGAHQDRRHAAAAALYSAAGVARDDRAARERQNMENFSFFRAPHVALVTTTAELGAYGVMDCGAYVATFLLSAESLGIGAIAQGSIAMHAGVVRAQLGLHPDELLVCALSFGYPDPEHPVNAVRTEREDVELVVQGLPPRRPAAR